MQVTFIYSTYFLKSKSVNINKKIFFKLLLVYHRIVRSSVQQEEIKTLQNVMKMMSFLRMNIIAENTKKHEIE